MSSTLIFGVLVGAIALLAVELLLSVLFYHWFSRRRGPVRTLSKRYPCCYDSDDERSLTVECHKQGIVWVLETEKIPDVQGNGSKAKGIKKETDDAEFVEVYPILKHAKLKNHKLILTDPGDSCMTTIDLLDCNVLAVSASDQATRKWSSRYPLKLESMSKAIYEGSKICYLFLDTSWEKESWCKALCFASCPEKRKIKKIYERLHEDFQQYAASVPEHLSPQRPFKPYCNPLNKAGNVHKTTRVRRLLNRFAKGMSKTGSALSSHGKKKIDDRLIDLKSAMLMNGFLDTSSVDKSSSDPLQDALQSGSLTPSYCGNKGHPLVLSNAASDNHFIQDNSAFFWNLIISRLFFDVKRSTMVNNFIKTQIQRTLSNMRFPSFFGRVECADLNIGDLPPYIHKVKVVNKDMSELLTAEIDLEYSGGVSFAFEVRQAECGGSSLGTNPEPNSGTRVALDHPEGLENNAEQIMVSDNLGDEAESKDKEKKIDEPEQLEGTTWKTVWMSMWEAIKITLADHVSQVPLTVSVRISSFSGTMAVHIKPPPSDQLWFGFTSMPEISWNIESTVGEHRINIGAISLLFKNIFENAIHESLVFPNSECICIPCMLDEKDNWLPVTEAPYQWVNQEKSLDVIDLNQETSMDVIKLNQEAFMEMTELKIPEPDQLHEATTSQVSPSLSSSQLCGNPNSELPKSEEAREKCGCAPMISLGEMILWEKAAEATKTNEDPRIRKKLSVTSLKKMVGETIEGQKHHIGSMVGVSLKKCGKVGMHNVFGRHAPTATSLQQ